MITVPGNCNGRSFSSPFCAVSRPSPGNSQGTACQCELKISHLASWVSERELLIAFSMVRGVAHVQWRAPSAASITFASWNDAWEAKERLMTAEPLGPQVEVEIVGPFKGGGCSGATEGEWLREPWNNSLDLHQSAARMDTLHGSLLGKNSSSWSCLGGRSCSFLDEESVEGCGDDGGGEMGVGLHTHSNPNNPSPRSFSLSLDDFDSPSMFATAERLGSNSSPWASSSGKTTTTISGYRSANNPNNPNVCGISAENAPCNTLYVGNLPPSASEEELREMFCGCIGYKRLSFKNKPNGPMCFVEFEDIHCATLAMNELYGQMLSNSAKAGIRLSYSKNPLGVKPGPGMISHPQAQRGPCMTLQPVDLIPRISPLY